MSRSQRSICKTLWPKKCEHYGSVRQVKIMIVPVFSKDRVKFFTIAMEEEVKSGAMWVCLGCYSIRPHIITGVMQIRDSRFLEEVENDFLSGERVVCSQSACSCFLLSWAW